MKIDLTEEQYVKLLKVLYLGTWTTDAFEGEWSGEFSDLEQQVFSYAKDFALEDRVVYDGDTKTYSYAPEFEKNSGVVQIINAYDDDVFWYELVHRMAERDFIRAHGTGTIGRMSIDERFQRADEYVSWYEEEFGAHDIENLAVVDKADTSDKSE